MSCKDFNYKCSNYIRKGGDVFLAFCTICEGGSGQKAEISFLPTINQLIG